MNDQLVTIATFDNSFAAESAKALLESSQIETFLLNSHASSIRPSLALHGGVRLQVLQSQAEDAIAILRAHYPPEEDHKKPFAAHPAKVGISSRKRKAGALGHGSFWASASCSQYLGSLH